MDHDIFEGIIQLDYKGKVRTVPYEIETSPGYGGLPFAGVTDVNNKYYSFVRDVNGKWDSPGVGPKWPSDFLELLFHALEMEYQCLQYSDGSWKRIT